jgi:hypothetical protein
MIRNEAGAFMADEATLGYAKYTVDLWLTDLNDVEFGLFRHTKHRAKSRQFSKDADVIGAVDVNGERTGVLSHRRGLWKDTEGMAKRLVVKLFTQDMNWRGSLELMLTRSVQLTLGARGFPVLSFLVNLMGNEQTITIERSGRQWPFMPESYSFFISDDKGVRFYRLRRKIIAIGTDYILYDASGKRVGYLDGRLIDLGGHWDVRLREDHNSVPLNSALQLFCGMLRFRRGCLRHVRQLARDIKQGRIKPVMDAQEADLYLNPRRQPR